MLNTQVDVQSEVYAEYASTRVTEAAEVGSIHISSASVLVAVRYVPFSFTNYSEGSYGHVRECGELEANP